MWFLGLKDSIGNAIQGALRSFGFLVCDFIYRGISYVYDIFARLASAEILSDTTVMAIYQRVGLVLGIFMVFKLSFTFIQIVINPDTISDKEKGAGGTILKAILVVVLLGTVPYMFSAAYEIQKAVIDDGIINRVVLGADAAQEEIDPGVDLAFNLIRGNYNVTSDASALNASSFDDADDVPKYLNGEEVNTYEACNAIVNEHNGNDPKLKWEMQNFGKMTYGKTCLNVMYEASDGTSQFLMDYDPLFCIIIGIFVLYMLVIYCLKAAERVVQLAFLQLIAPVPIMSYLSPKKDGLFDKWVKMCITTFLDIFIRTAVLSLTAALALIILSDDTGNVLYNTTGQPGGFKWFLIQALVIIGLFFFAKRVPELLKELFPSAGAASLGGMFTSPKKMFQEGMPDFAKRAYGAAAVGTGRAIGNIRNGIGKTLDGRATKKNNADYQAYKQAKKDYRQALKDGDDIMAQDALSRMQLHKEGARAAGADQRKWMRRTLTGGLSGLVGGGVAGLGTTDKSGRKSAVSTGVDRTKSNYKVKDSGYGARERATDFWKNRAWNRDSDLDIMTKGTETAMSNLDQQIAEMQQNMDPATSRNIYSQGGKYYEIAPNGKYSEVQSDGSASFQLADLQAQRGKVGSTNSALNQKKREQESKK